MYNRAVSRVIEVSAVRLSGISKMYTYSRRKCENVQIRPECIEGCLCAHFFRAEFSSHREDGPGAGVGTLCVQLERSGG